MLGDDIWDSVQVVQSTSWQGDQLADEEKSSSSSSSSGSRSRSDHSSSSIDDMERVVKIINSKEQGEEKWRKKKFF